MFNNLHQAQSHDILRSWQSQRNDINHHKDFVLPLFIGNEDNACESIETMPGVYRYGINKAIEYLEPLVYSFGLRAVLLFPVITKSDQTNYINDDDENQEMISSSQSLASSSTSQGSSSPSSSSSSTGSSDNEEDDNIASKTRRISEVVPERLIAAESNDLEETTTTTSNINNSQNPFLNQNEEEEDHLLANDINNEHTNEKQTELADSERKPPPSSVPPILEPPPRAKEIKLLERKKIRSLDVKLIETMALKDDYNPVLRLIPVLRAKFPDLLIICDVCLCAFTATGHCCLFDENPIVQREREQQQLKRSNLLSPSSFFKNNNNNNCSSNHNNFKPASNNPMHQLSISNRVTCQYLSMLSVEYARRGCNVIAPSDMMDGRILTIRQVLDEFRFNNVAILSYSAKFASSFYGPFRQATNNAPEFGDRRAYQLPPGSRAMALKAVDRDIKQGADFIMVKPGSPYLDIVRDIREKYESIPVAVYQVSGEYAMLKLAAQANIIDLKRAVNETLTSFRRAGASIIITYFTPELLRGEL